MHEFAGREARIVPWKRNDAASLRVGDQEDLIGQAANFYRQLVSIVDTAGVGMTSTLREATVRTDAPLVNVNRKLSRFLLS